MRSRDTLVLITLSLLAASAQYACSDSTTTKAQSPDGGSPDASTPDAEVDGGPTETCSGQFQSAIKGGGPGQGDEVRGVALDKDGNAWIVGTYIGDATWDSVTLATDDKTHTTGFVVKLDPAGKPLFARSLGDAGGIANYADRVRVDAKGNAYVAGSFDEKLDLDDVHLVQSNTGTAGAAYVLALDPSGKALWGAASANNGGSREAAHDVAVDANGDVYLTGSYNGQAVFGSITVDGTSSEDAAFVAKYSPAQSAWVWAKGWGGNTPNSGGIGYGVSVTPDGKSVYAAGHVAIDIDIEGRALAADRGSWVVKLDASDGHALWATAVTPSSDQGKAEVHSVATDAAGDLYVTGEFTETAHLEAVDDGGDGGDDAGADGASVTATGGTDMFLARYDADGKPTWVKHAGGGTGITRGDDVALDGAGGLYVSGFKQGDIAFDATTLTSTGNAFLARYDATGAALWAIGNDNDNASGGEGLAVSVTSPTSGVVMGGSFVGPTTFGTSTLESGADGDAFVARVCN